MNIIKRTWLKYEPAVLAGLLFGCGIIIGAVIEHHLGRF